MKALYREICQSSRQPRNLQNHLKIFGFHEMNSKNRSQLTKLIRTPDQKIMYADLLAAQAKAMMGSGLLNENAVPKALVCCEDFLHGRKFQDVAYIPELISTLSSASKLCVHLWFTELEILE